MSHDEITWFPSKVDWWLGAVLVLVPVTSVTVIVSAVLHRNMTEAMIGVFMAVFVGALYGLLVLPMRYGISAEELVVRHGVVRWRTRLDAIKEVRPSHNPLSAPALSLDRLEVRTGKGLLGSSLISPADRDAFMTLLAQNGGLTRDGDRLIREG